MVKSAFIISAFAVLVGLAGCQNSLMPTPNVYAHGQLHPFADVPPALQKNYVDVLYLTDRQREDEPPSENAKYGYDRSRSLAFGLSRVQFGNDLTWDQLVAASETQHRPDKINVRVTGTTEVGRFPPTPRTLIELPTAAGSTTQPSTQPTTLSVRRDEAMAKAQALLSQQLALSPTKDVYIFVHGFNNTFDDSVEIIAELWHFLGRQGVPVAYSWPAGHTGLFEAYNYDRESSEFTVYHFKEMLRRIAENPDVHQIHIIAHSRGTDVVMTALRELHLEISGSGRSTRQVLKLGTLILAAPDLDFEVIVQRVFTANLQYVPQRMVVYVCAADDALSLSSWLFGGMMRLGKLRAKVFTASELDAMRKKTSFEIVDVRVANAGFFDHDYFHSNPAVSSDIVLVMRYHCLPGAANGRPLKVEAHEFWTIDDKYPSLSTPLGRSSPATQPN